MISSFFNTNIVDTSKLDLKRIRKKNKWTQADLASKLGVHPNTIVNYEKGEVIPDSKMQLLQTLLTDTQSPGPILHEPASMDYGIKRKGIAFYADIDVTAGQSDLFNDGSIRPTGFIQIPNFEDCDNAFPLYGDSMYPKYQAGQIILCKEFKDWPDYVPYGEVFLVITDSLRIVKYVKKASNQDNYLLVSENNHFEDFEVPKHRIRKMYIVKGAIHRNMI